MMPQTLNPDYALDPCWRRGYPNYWDHCLTQDTRLWEDIQCNGGIAAICQRAEAPRYAVPPWINMPPQGRRFQEIQTLPIAGLLPGTGLDTTVIQFRVPVGYDGVLMEVINRFLGLGFVEGSGTLSWRIRINNRFVMDYGNIQTSLGDLTSPVPLRGGGIRLKSNQIVRYIVNVAVGAEAVLDPGGRIMCAATGWHYPRP